MDEGQPAPSTPGGSRRPPADLQAQSPPKARREELDPSNADILSYMKSMLTRSEENSQETFGHLTARANQVHERMELLENNFEVLELPGGGAGGGVDEQVRR